MSNDQECGLQRAVGPNRRDFVKSAMAVALGGNVLNHGANANTPPAEDISCIFILLVGGPSQVDTWDPKPEAVQEVRGPYRPIATRVPGIWISELFPRLADIMDKVSIVRTLCHQNEATHDRGHQAIQTGREFCDDIEHPHYGSVVARLKGPRGQMPPYCLLPGPLGRTGGKMSHGQDAGYLGDAYSPMVLQSCAGSAPPGVTRLVPLVQTSYLSQESLVRTTATLQEETRSACNRYGGSSFGLNCLRARRFIEAGARFVTINMFDTVLDTPSWDMHGYAPFSTFSSLQKTVCPRFDIAFAALIKDLDERGLLSSTMVVAAGEFGRRPWVNGSGGRDHHASCWSGLLAGGRVRGGRVIGCSDRIGEMPTERPVTMQEFAATMYHGLNIPCDTRLSGPDAQSIGVVDPGVQPVYELF
jgi:hypothetical protein